MLAVAAIGLGILAGLLMGGAPGHLRQVRIRHEWAVLILFLVQGFARGRILGSSAVPIGTVVWVISSGALVLFLLADWRLPGVWIASVGIGMNLLVVLLNSGMPVVLAGVVGTNGGAGGIAASGGFYQAATTYSIATALADTLPVSVFGNRLFASVGDILLVTGVAVVISSAMTMTGRDADSAHFCN